MEKVNQEEKLDSQLKGILIVKILEMKEIVVIDYQIDENPTKINFLKDYSEFLLQSKLYDEKIINWQIENKESLMKSGLDLNTLKKVFEIFINLSYFCYLNNFMILQD